MVPLRLVKSRSDGHGGWAKVGLAAVCSCFSRMLSGDEETEVGEFSGRRIEGERAVEGGVEASAELIDLLRTCGTDEVTRLNGSFFPAPHLSTHRIFRSAYDRRR